MKRCHRCQTEWVSEAKRPGFKELCSSCSSYLHCCINCRHHNPSLHNQCAISTTDFVSKRDGSNFCEDFEFKDDDPAAAENSGGAQARGKLDALFGDDAGTNDRESLDRFKDLFD